MTLYLRIQLARDWSRHNYGIPDLKASLDSLRIPIPDIFGTITEEGVVKGHYDKGREDDSFHESLVHSLTRIRRRDDLLHKHHIDVVLLFEKNSLDCIFDSRWGNDPRFKMARRLRGRIVYQSIRRGPSSPPRGRRDSVSVSRDRGRRSRERSPRDNYHHASRRSRSRTRRGPIDRTHDREPSRSAQYRDSSVHRSVREDTRPPPTEPRSWRNQEAGASAVPIKKEELEHQAEQLLQSLMQETGPLLLPANNPPANPPPSQRQHELHRQLENVRHEITSLKEKERVILEELRRLDVNDTRYDPYVKAEPESHYVTQYAGAPSQPPSTNIHPFTAQLQPQPQPQPQPQVQPQPQLQAVYQQTRTSGFQLTPAMLEAYERSRLSQASRFQAPVSVPASDAGPSNSNQQYSRPDFDFTQNVAYTLNGW